MEYKLIRSKRKSLTISITNGEITVKAPLKTPMSHIEAFIGEKSNWIERKIAEQKRKTDLLSNVIAGECVLYHGAFLKAVSSADHKRIKIDGEYIFIPEKYKDRTAADKALTAFLKRLAENELNILLADVSARTGLGYASFALTNARTKWGSCDGKCNIRLNWRLIMLDAELVEYVLIHELAHTVYHDHSKSFWAEVAKFMPRYNTAKKRLKTYSVLTSMYR